MTITLEPITEARCVVRQTHVRRGRTLAVEPGRTASRHLRYGRIILDAGAAPVVFATAGHETGLVALKGSASVEANGAAYALERYDALYVPRDGNVIVRPGPEGCDLAEISAPVEKLHPVQPVRFKDIQKDPSLHFRTGGPGAERELNVLLGKNVHAGRIMAGVTFSNPGNWTSWPPHEHGHMLEEAYLYIAMPEPGWGIQLVYTNPRQPELAVVVREGDCVLMPQGYHPNVAAPGSSIGFLWMMAAIREDEDRQFGVVNVQPEYRQAGSGLEASLAGTR